MNFENASTAATSMNLKLVVIEETKYYPPEIQLRAGKVFQTYVYDASVGHHLCEITPSFELHPLNTTPLNHLEDEEQREALHEVLDEANRGSDVRYWHCRAIERIPATHKKDFRVVERDPDEDYEQQFESQLDYLRGNVQLELPAGVHGEYVDVRH